MTTQYGGFFNAQKIDDIRCDTPDSGRSSDYILSVNPNYSDAPDADDFAMCVLRPFGDKVVVVDTYAKRGVSLFAHLRQFLYFLETYSIGLIIEDATQGEALPFTEIARESEVFEEVKLPETLKVIGDHDWTRASNEVLQACLDFNRISFATPLDATGQANLDALRKQLKMIEVKTSALGHLSWDISTSLPNERRYGPNRQRKGLYEALLLAVWGSQQLQLQETAK